MGDTRPEKARTMAVNSTQDTETLRKRGRSTIKEVAKDADVSIAAVSKVLRNAGGISEPTRLRIEASIAKLDYRPLTSARGMRGQTYNLGIILSDIANPFFSEILVGIHNILDATPYQPLLGVSMGRASRERSLINSMVDRQADGLILIAPHLSEQRLLQLSKELPVVTFGYHKPDATTFDTVNTEDFAGGEMAVEHLLSAGHRNIAMLSSAALPEERPRELTGTHHREQGYLKAMKHAGLEHYSRIVRAGSHPEEICQQARIVLSEADRPTALFCWADYYAFHVISLAKEMKLAIPKDLAVVGFDNTPSCRLGQNDLSSVDQSGAELGEMAAKSLIGRIGGRSRPIHALVGPRLINRGSSARHIHRGN